MKVKLCGFSEEKSLKAAIDAGIDFVGFVFCEKSPRNISVAKARALQDLVPQNVAKVAVVVDGDLSFLQEIAGNLNPQYFQLHGDQNLAEIAKIRQKFPKIGIIKAFSLKNEQDLRKIDEFTDFVDLLLFDGIIAGSGKEWDYSLLEGFKCKKKWFLSGGLNIDNVLKAVEISGAKMVDISSGIEEIRGVKSEKLIAEIMRKIKNYAD